MEGLNKNNRSYIGRRKKEYLSFLVVRFLKAYDNFNGIYKDFSEYKHKKTKLAEFGLFERMKNLEETLFSDIEEKSRFLFRSEIETRYDDLKNIAASKYTSIKESKVKTAFSALRKSLLNKSVDSNIRRILHILTILKESFYEFQYYEIEYVHEHNYIGKIESLSNQLGHAFNDDERHEFNHIKVIDKLSRKILSDTKNHTEIALDRCRTLFYETSEILLHVIQECRRNEVLTLNLLIEKELVDKIYGSDASERIFSEMYKHLPSLGNSGLEKAINYLKDNCGNITALPEDIRSLATNDGKGSQRTKEYASFKKRVECYFQEND